MGVILILLTGTGCRNRDNESDAFGNFESDEVIVSAEENGRLLQFDMDEGDRLEKGQGCGLIDTTMLVLNLKQMEASRASVNARILQLYKTLDVQKARIDLMQTEADRITRMHQEGAATAQQFDKVTGELKVAFAEREQVRSQRAALLAEEQLVMARMEAANEQLNRCHIKAPVSGIILQKYVDAGELAVTGKPLFKMAETSELTLRAYVAGSQLRQVAIGQTVTVRYDKDKEDYSEKKGVVYWVSSSAEFTPKIIQTKEERVDLVYAIKVRVPNPEGELKIGMPGEVRFKRSIDD
jgi:HlyD family secretion protein